ncbi:uncharacterized protein LOC135837995 isoform X2 [Planococcus citri]|uniref:uncharacterized protein LOC135837995 isoform X2 n=2 Tax=Planococcus citri TaxID=170843 RepID=UPI0031F816D3
MRLALWTVGLIFLQIAITFVYSSDKYLKVTNYGDEYQDDVDPWVSNQQNLREEHEHEQEHVTSKKPRFQKLDNFIKQTFARFDNNHVDRSEPEPEPISTEKSPPIRHRKRHNRRLHSDYSKNDLKSSKEPDPWSKDPVQNKPGDTNFLDMEMNDAAPALSPVSQAKLDNYGSDDKVREKFQQTYGTLPASIKSQDPFEKAANAHYDDMKRRTLCKLPIPKIVRVDDVYPNVLKTYHPSCTILHQCSEESGCCSLKNNKCTPSSTQNVTLYFIVRNKPSTSKSLKQTYEGLSFINHTECRCTVAEPDRRTRAVLSLAQPSPIQIVPKSQHSSYLKKCPSPCPSSFSHRFMADGTCICECNGDENCQKYRRGELMFNLQDHFCLFTNQCIYPSCAYGNYLAKLGRCPKQYEQRPY